MEENLKFRIRRVFDKELEQEWIYLSKSSEISIFDQFDDVCIIDFDQFWPFSKSGFLTKRQRCKGI